MSDKKIATLLREVPAPSVLGHASRKLWHLEPPLVDQGWGDDEPTSHSIVITSAVNHSLSGIVHIHETYVFPADERTGEITDWGELDGSIKDTTDHEAAIRAAGYEPVTA